MIEARSFQFQLIHFALLAALLIGLLAGCDAPAPQASSPPGPPPPPPPAAPAPKPAPPPPKSAPDPYGVAVDEIVKVLQRYPAVYAGIHDEVSADKAVEEIGQLASRLKKLAAEISNLPHRPGQEKYTLALQGELTRMQTAPLTNPDMQRVLADPEMQIKLLAAHQTFTLEGMAALVPALLARQSTAPQAASPTAPAAASTPK